MTEQIKPLSKSAHKSLTFYGWKTEDGKVYINDLLPGDKIELIGYTLPIAGRSALAWKHDRAGCTLKTGSSFVSHGIQALDYHIMRADPMYPNRRAT